MRCSFGADALFAPGSAELTDDAVARLTALAQRALVDAGDSIVGVRVEGHTDHRGGDDDNLALSEARAAAAADVLSAAGIPADVVEPVGLGETQAQQGSPTDAEMAADRRVDIVIAADVEITTRC